MPETTFIVTCPSCGTNNRIPAANEGLRGRCGSCQAALPPLYHQPKPLTDQTFNPFIKDFPGPVLAEFWAPW